MDKQTSPELKALSASRVKTLENCSWLYWCNYHLKIPQEKNEGAKKGDVCHRVFELLLKKDRVRHFNQMILAESVEGCPAVARLIKRYIKRMKIHGATSSFLQIDQMILVGLKNDFYVKGGVLVYPEFKFDLTSEKPRFRIKGLMDKPFIKGEEIIIDDYKSSKKKFAGEDQESNLQALFYSFAASQLWPHLKPKIRFIFLQYPENPMMELEFTPDALLGFSYYLEATQLKVEGFNEFVAKGNFAYDTPASQLEFKGKLLCGFATHPNQLKKDGTKMWHCPYRFGFDYYAIKKDDKVVSTFLHPEEGRKLKDGETLEKLHYDGCPKHVNPLDSMPPTPTKAPPIKYPNVLDDLI